MDLLKRIFSGDKLSSYEKEQKRRYKQYVKLGTTSTIVMSKSESEIYQDYLIRKSLRRSKRKASAMKAQNEDIFKETNTNPGLSAAPAVLDAVNRNVSITNVPNDYLNDLKEMETITTVQTHIPNSHSTQERPQSTQFEGNATALESMEADPAPITTTEPLDEKFAFGNQEKFLNQLDEVIRNRSKDQSRGSTTSTASTLSTTPSSPLYENTKDLEGQFLSVPVAKPRKKVERSWKKANRHSDNVESYAAKQQEQMDEISTITHTIQLPTDSQENSEDTYQTESMEEIVWGTPPSNLLPMSRKDDDIYDDEEKKIMKQISPPFRERKESYNDPETDFRSLGSEEGLEQDSLQPPRYDSIIKDEKYIQHQEVNNAPNNPESIQHKLETSNNISEDIIEPDSLEMQIELPIPANNLAPKLKIIDVEPQVEPERQVEIEHVDGVEREDVSELESKSKPEAKERNINNMTSWMERVRMKERDFVSTEFSKEKVREYEEVQIQDEALLLDEHYHNFKDDPEFLKIPESHRANKNHLIKLENNNDYSDFSIESDRADGKKVTFDFAKSYCQTYEVDDDIDNGDEDETTSSIRIGENRVLNPIGDELYLEDHYRRPSKMQRHNLENLYIPTDDRTRVFLSYGIQPTPTPEEEIIDKIFENSINMDLAFLNCVDDKHNGTEIKIEADPPENRIDMEANDEVHNSYNNNASRLALSLENPPIPEVSEDTPKYSRYNMSKPTSNISLGRSTSESTLNKYKARRPDIYSNRNVFTSNARKPLIRSTSHSFGYDTSQKFNEKGIDGERKESHSQTSSNCDFPEVEGNSIQSLSEIQRRLSEVRNIEAAETQLQQIQNILVHVKQRADMLESKTEDEYVHLLQTLFKSIRIVSGLQCNFDQDLLESQQKTLKDIKDCISYLNTK
ncbi:hypothetical protein Trydic_g3480 [Trypoxylus dichotomus]